ncbi:MAG: DISARM system helicase DrmA [Thermoleophilia bacterium]
MTEELTNAAVDYPQFEGTLTRDRLLAALRFDLLGPESEDEVLLQSPKTRYLVGMLAPRGTELDAAEDDEDAGPGEGDEGDNGRIPLRVSLEASSIGISVVVDSAVGSLTARATWGAYAKISRVVEEEIDSEDALDLERDADPDVIDGRRSKEVTEWVREPQQMVAEIPLTEERAEGFIDEHGVQIRYITRVFDGNRIVSVFLDNARDAPLGKRPRDEDYLYQPTLTLTGVGSPFLPRRRTLDHIDPDPDIASADLIYRNRLEFAVGHGVAVGWPQGGEQARADEVWTEMIPAHEVPKVTPRESEKLSMDVLGGEAKAVVFARLNEFLAEYETWLNDRNGEIGAIETPIRPVATDHLTLARMSLDRMRSGVAALEDQTVFQAFQFANRAMGLQRRHSVQVRAKRRGEPVPTDADISADWRPFQVGFVLQTLAGLVDPAHEDRGVADLLWFPTGGGKTEAYLGLTAFVLALRRLRTDERFHNTAGTGVIMRYTLRLLTIQQFQRALTLIAACEHLRTQDSATWGDERFTIGLWVGRSVTPNSYDEAKAALNKLKKGEEVYEESPYQVLYCPWCGEDLKPGNYIFEDESERIYIKCCNLDCDFHTTKAPRGIPALVVDSEIYRNPPSLLLATVDKFAQMTWNGRIQSLFGRVERHCPRHGWISSADDHPTEHKETQFSEKVVVTKALKLLAPPDLIIQDELHLISGPLGTLVGIYESVVDSLCSYERQGTRVRPKVVASTATVRRASRQVRSLFDRETAVFPPLGLDANDSFFAEEDGDEPGRLYVGVFGPGRSIKTTLVRTYGCLLGRAAMELDGHASSETDAYMTLVGYFNSLRELGGAVRLVEDDVRSRLRALKRRGFSDDRIIYEYRELTSRKSSSQISNTLDALDRTHLEKKQGEYPIDVLLSSNMISVGVDIDRLGLMVVSGQPKTTAEYIQATSRVGRAYPGLVIQVYNWIRPRDISHYERFHHYHSTFYRHVEATSVTPFSERARDRALPAVLVAHARLSEPEWSREQGAALFDSDRPSVVEFSELMIERARSIARHGDDAADELRRQIENRLFEWDQLAKDPNRLVYSSRGQDKGKTRAVLLRPMELESTMGQWQASGSLREVEEEVPVVLKDYGKGDV